MMTLFLFLLFMGLPGYFLFMGFKQGTLAQIVIGLVALSFGFILFVRLALGGGS